MGWVRHTSWQAIPHGRRCVLFGVRGAPFLLCTVFEERRIRCKEIEGDVPRLCVASRNHATTQPRNHAATQPRTYVITAGVSSPRPSATIRAMSSAE